LYFNNNYKEPAKILVITFLILVSVLGLYALETWPTFSLAIPKQSQCNAKRTGASSNWLAKITRQMIAETESVRECYLSCWCNGSAQKKG